MSPPNVLATRRTLAHPRQRSVYEFGAPEQILTGFASWLHYCSDVAHRRPAKLCTIFGRLLSWYSVYIFGGCCPLTECCHAQIHFASKSCVTRILAALLHSTPAAGVSQTLRRGTGVDIIGDFQAIFFIQGPRYTSGGPRYTPIPRYA